MESQIGSNSDRGMGNIATDALCAAECDKRESCRFYVYKSSIKWCYLWQGATCSPIAYNDYKIKRRVCGAGNTSYLLLWHYMVRHVTRQKAAHFTHLYQCFLLLWQGDFPTMIARKLETIFGKVFKCLPKNILCFHGSCIQKSKIFYFKVKIYTKVFYFATFTIILAIHNFMIFFFSS